MNRLLYLVFFALLSATIFGSGLYAQTKFELPARSPDYKSYLYFEDCIAAVVRIKALPLAQASVVDTFLQKREAKYKPISEPAKDTGLICSNKWLPDSIASGQFVRQRRSELMMLGKRAEVLEVYTKIIDSLHGGEKDTARTEIINLFWAFLTKETVKEWLELSDIRFRNIPQDSSARIAVALAGQIASWIGLWEPEKADSVLNQYLTLINSSPEIRKHSLVAGFIAPKFFPTAQLVKEPEILTILSQSTANYSRYLHDLWFKIGNDNPTLMPIDSIAPQIVGKWWYAPQVDSRRPYSAVKVSAESLIRPRSGKVNVIAFVDPGCHSSSPKANTNQFLRKNGDGVCNILTLPALNRLKELYPDIQITIVSRTFGSFGSTISASAESEAETIAKYIIDHWQVDATVAVEETEFFRLPGDDRRRIDLPTLNDANFTIANHRLSRDGSVILTDQDGKIFYAGSITKGHEVGVRNMVGVVLKRNQPKTARY